MILKTGPMRTRAALILSLAVVATTACATPYEGLRRVKATPSDTVIHRVGTFKGTAGTELFFQAWLPRTDVRAVLVIVHGLKDHSSRYDAFARKLAERGIAVHAFDLRGHGRSAGHRVAVDDFDDYVSDLDQYLLRLIDEYEQFPLFLFGHSMGGAVAASFAATRQHALKGLVLSGPALALDIWPITIAASRVTGFLLGNLPALKLPNKNFSRDPETVAAMTNDPLVYQDSGPARTAAELAIGIETIWANVEQFTMPLLLLHGDEDKLTKPEGSIELFRRAPSRDKKLEIYRGRWHDLLHDPDHEQVEADIIEWLEKHIEPPQL